MTSVGTVVSSPTPAYSNLPIEPQFYQPSQFVVTAVTLGFPTIVTTAVDHNYVIGQQVRLLIPSSYGCWQLNGAQASVIYVPAANQVSLWLDSQNNVNSFKAGSSTSIPQIIAIGDYNSGNTNGSGNLNLGTGIPGAFINISPN